jgi:hypothetical protein
MGFSFTNIDGKMPVKRFKSAIKNLLRLLMVFLTFSIVNCEKEFNKTQSEHEKTDCTAFLFGRITSFFHLKLNCQIGEKKIFLKVCELFFQAYKQLINLNL